MANLPFSFFKQNSKTYEVKDAQARADITQLNSAFSKHIIGETVNLSSYTDQNWFTCPSDGYVMITGGTPAGSVTSAQVGNDPTHSITFSVATTGGTSSLFVKAGMKVRVFRNGAASSAYYKPII